MLTPEQAIEAFRERVQSLEPVEVLYASVAERFALRDPPGTWQVLRCAPLVRLFVKDGDRHVSRYVWDWKETDSVIDALLEKVGDAAA